MTLDELERMAKAAKPSTDKKLSTTLKAIDYQNALDRLYEQLSPKRILAMIECVRAADAMYVISERKHDVWIAYDAARAKLDEVGK